LIGDGQGVVDGIRVGNPTYNSTEKDSFSVSGNEDGEYGLFIKPHAITADETLDLSEIGEHRHDKPDYELLNTLERQEGKVLIAKIVISGGVVTEIDNSVQKYLVQRDNMKDDLVNYINSQVAKAKREIYSFILGQFTEQIRDEIAAGDQAVRDELDLKITDVQSQIDNLDLEIETVRTSLYDLQSYIEGKIESLETKTEDLTAAVISLSNSTSENADFIEELQNKVADISDDIIANQVKIEQNIVRLEALENQNIVAAGKWEQTNAINTAKNTFRISVIDRRLRGTLSNGFFDTFEDILGIDAEKSSEFSLISGTIRAGTKSLPNGCVACFPMDDGAGFIVKDYSPVGNDAILGSDGKWVEGKFGRGIQLEGNSVNSYIAAPRVAAYKTYLTEFTMMLHFKRDVIDTKSILISPYRTTTTHLFILEDNRIAFHDSSRKWLFGPTVADTNWHHLAVTTKFDTFQKMYLDGVVVAASPTSYYTHVAYPTIGNRAQSQVNYLAFDGIVDDVGIFEVVLSDSDIAYYANNPIIGTTGEVDAIVVTNAYDADSAPDTVMVLAEDAGDVSYEVSRDDGVTWTAANKNEETDISAQPEGTKMRVKAIIPNGSVLDNIALIWS